MILRRSARLTDWHQLIAGPPDRISRAGPPDRISRAGSPVSALEIII